MNPPRPLLGVLLVALAVLAFALSDVLTKHLAMRYPVPVVVAVRYLVSLALLLVLLWPRHRSALWRTQRTGPVLLRGLVLALASLTMGLALQLMPVAETIAILYLSPFAVMLLAGPILGEKVGPAAYFGTAVGFAGVLLILRPGGGLDAMGVVWALINAALATAFHLMTRGLARTETTLAMLFHVTLVGAVFFSVAALGSLDIAPPAPRDFGLMALLGALATLGHFLFTAAYREAPASMLAPVNYLHLVWAAGLGWLVFGHLPDALSLTGIALVCAAGAAVALRAQRGKAVATEPAEA